MRVIFWGTPELAVPCLEKIFRDGHDIAAAITQPDRRQGRKQRIQFSPVKQFAVDNKISVLQPQSPGSKEFAKTLAQIAPDIMVVVAYGKIFTKRLLNMKCRHGWINVHFSLLPKYRGASPVVAALLAGEKETGVTVMRVVRKMDAGPILAQRSMPISTDDTTGSLSEKLQSLGASLLVEVLTKLPAGEITETPQRDGASYCYTIKKEEGLMDWQKSAEQLERHVRAMSPWPGAYFFYHRLGKPALRLLAKASRVVAQETNILPGTVVETGKGIDVATGRGILRLTKIQRAGKSALFAEDFLRGVPIEKGDQFKG